jgi:hypothetical protein
MKALRHLAYAFPAFALTGLLVGCASIGAPVPPSLELPKPPTDLRALRKGSKVYLFWTVPTKTTDRQNVRRPGPTRICRSLAAVMSECDTPVETVPPAVNTPEPEAQPKNGPKTGPTTGKNPKPQAEFVDILPAELQQQNPTRMATYAVEELNTHARSAGLSNQVQVPLAPTSPPPPNFHAQVTSDGVVLTWDCEQPPTASPNIRYVYRIYRRSVDSGTEARLADVECPNSRYEDRTSEWQKSYEYRMTVVTIMPSQNLACAQETGSAASKNCVEVSIEGDDSPVQTLFTKDIYPPGVPTGLQAVFSGPGQPPLIDLLWAPDTDADLAGYNVYRREEGTQSVKVNTDLVKTPAFRDQNVAPGKTYRYSVSALDLRGNESARSEEASESVPQSP